MLPLEIVEYIAGFLWDDRRTLRTYSLVCHDWYLLIRPHLYRRLQLRYKYDLLLLGSLLETSPFICNWVRELAIVVPDTTPHAMMTKYYWNIEPPQEWIYKITDRLPSKLTSLQTLEFQNLSHFSIAELGLIFAEALNSFVSVTSLNFKYCRLPHYVFSRWIRLLPNLEHLHLHEVMIDEWASHSSGHRTIEETEDVSHARFPLKSLRIHGENAEFVYPLPTFFLWVTETSAVFSLTSLELYIKYPSNLIAVGEFLTTLGPSLHHLTLKFGQSQHWNRDRNYGDIVKYLNIIYNTELRSLTLHDPRHPGVAHLISKASSPYLEYVKFYISFTSPRTFKTRGCGVVDELLTKPSFHTLKRIRFEYGGCVDHDAVARKIRKAFPRANAMFGLDIVKANDPFVH